jgi:hypothetical protein
MLHLFSSKTRFWTWDIFYHFPHVPPEFELCFAGNFWILRIRLWWTQIGWAWAALVLCTGSPTLTSWAGLGTKCKFKTDLVIETGSRYRINFFTTMYNFSSNKNFHWFFITFQIVLWWDIAFAIFPAVKLKTHWSNNTYWRFIQNHI